MTPVFYFYFQEEMVEQDYINEKKASAREFEEHKVYLREQLIAELEEKQKLIETERHNMELTGDSTELKTISTRKLRKRNNEPSSEHKLLSQFFFHFCFGARSWASFSKSCIWF